LSSSSPNGTYGTGAAITINVNFNQAVMVTGAPKLLLNSAGTALYSSGSGTSTLTFTYTVAANNTTNGGKLNEKSTTALTLNGGTINDSGGNAANLTLPALNSSSALAGSSDIVIDAKTPSIQTVTSPTSNGTYGGGALIKVAVKFSESVTVTGTPTLTLNSGGTASFASGSGTNTLIFNYTVAVGDTTFGGKLNYASTTALSLNGGTIDNAGGMAAKLTLPATTSVSALAGSSSIVIDTVPYVKSITTTKPNGTYGPGVLITIQVALNKAVNVTGTPKLSLSSGGIASYAAGSGTSTLSFNYTVALNNTTKGTALNEKSTTALSLNGGTINDGGGNPANLTLPALTASTALAGSSDIVIDATTPTVTKVDSTTPNGTYGAGTVIAITVHFSENATVDTTGGTPSLALNSGGTANYSSGTGTNTLTFTYTVGSNDTTNGGRLEYLSTTALSLNGGTIKNTGGVVAKLALKTPGTAGSLSYNDDIVIT
jgi:hypothetical protein